MILPRLKNNKTPELNLNKLQLEMKEQVEKKIDKGIYTFEKIDCIICNEKEYDLIGEKDRYGLFFSTNICHNCGLVYTSPRMTQDSYNQFYNLEYRKLYGGIEKPTKTFFDQQRRKGKRLYNFLHQNNIISSSAISVLEVGCGAGGILDLFREMGARVKGIDLGKEYIEYGKEMHNLDLETGTLDKVRLPFKPDLIIYSHVLEHILDVNKEIELIKRISDENTIIYIEVPGIKQIHKNYEMNILKYFQNAHTFHFTLESLENLMGKHGLELIYGNQFVMSAFKKSNVDFSINNDYKATVDYIVSIERKKRFYILTKSGLVNSLTEVLLKLLNITHTRYLARKLKSAFS